MPRIREFDPEIVAQKAMELFWRKGFADTSVRDLVEYTGVAHAGLYAEFGDKEGLYSAALKKYLDIFVEEMSHDLEKPTSGRAEVVGFFEKLLAGAEDGRYRNGCMVANGCVEFSNMNMSVNNAVLMSFTRITKALQAAIERAVISGDVNQNIDPERVAVAMTNTFQGMSIQCRAGAPIETLRMISQAAIDQLD